MLGWLEFLQLFHLERVSEFEELLLLVLLPLDLYGVGGFFDLVGQFGQLFLEVGLLLDDILGLFLELNNPLVQPFEGVPGEEDGVGEVLLEPGLVGHLDSVLYLGEPDREGDIHLVDFEQLFLLVDFQLFLGVCQRYGYIFDFGVDLVSLLLEVALALGVLLDLLVILAYLPYPFEVLVVVFDHGYVRLLVLVLELVIAIVGIFFLLLFVLIVILVVALLLLLFHLGLLLQFAYSLPLPDLVVADDPLPHLVVVRVHELSQDFLLFLVLLLELFVQDLYLADFCGQLQEGGLEVGLVGAVSPQLAHQLLVVGLHVPENDELLRVGQDLHFN